MPFLQNLSFTPVIQMNFNSTIKENWGWVGVTVFQRLGNQHFTLNKIFRYDI